MGDYKEQHPLRHFSHGSIALIQRQIFIGAYLR
jgi:hypothetical protein